MKDGKTAGPSGVVSEMLKAAGEAGADLSIIVNKRKANFLERGN